MQNASWMIRKLNRYKQDLSSSEIGAVNLVISLINDNPEMDEDELSKQINHYIDVRRKYLSSEEIFVLEDIDTMLFGVKLGIS